MLPSGLPDELDPGEDLARFLTQSGHFNAQFVKPNAFIPTGKPPETSVSRHGEEPREGLWDLGKIAAGQRKLYGAAIFKVRDAIDIGLSPEADEPPDRHAALRGWPTNEEDPRLTKAQQKERAIVLASASTKILM